METVALVVVKVHGCYALGAPVLLSWTPGCQLQHVLPYHSFLLHHRTGQYSPTEYSSSLGSGGLVMD